MTAQDVSLDVLGLLRSENHLIGIPAKSLSELTRIVDLEPLLSSRPEVLGALTLRDSVIPVLDPLVLCGLPARGRKPEIAAVVHWNDKQVALACDQVEDLYHCQSDTLQNVLGDYTDPLMRGQLNTPSGVVTVFDVAALFNNADLPHAQKMQNAYGKQKNMGLTAHLLFRSGGVTFAVDVKNIFSTSPGAALTKLAVENDVFLGMIEYLNHKIAVANINAVLKMDTQFEQETPEIVILKMDEGALLGLAVDEIINISLFDLRQLAPLPDYIQKDAPLIKTTVTDPTQHQNVLVLDVEACQHHHALRELTKIAHPVQPTNPDFEDATETSKDLEYRTSKIFKERVRNILFFAGIEIATPANSIVSVIKPPSKVIPWHSDVAGLRGLFAFQDELLPLVDLAAFRGEAPIHETDLSRVLVSEKDGRKVGFLVDRIGSISLSKRYIKNPDDEPDFVEIQEWPKDRMVCQIPLSTLAWSVSERL